MTVPEKAVEWAVGIAKDEEWKPIKGFPGYFVSNLGNVKGIKNRILKPNAGRAYLTVPLYNKMGQYRFPIHRLVATAFVPNPNNLPMVNHKDENKRNNQADNLEWCDSKYNNTYGEKIWGGRRKVAEKRQKHVLQVVNGECVYYPSIRDAARSTGVNRHCISRACNGLAHTAGGFSWRFAT